MELHFRQRLDRPDKLGRAAIFGDLHWAGGHRWKMPIGVKVLPAHWQPTKTKRIHTSAPEASALNLRLTRLLTAVQGVFTTAEGQGRAEASVTTQELQAALLAVGAGSRRVAPVTPPPLDPDAPAAGTATWPELLERWQRENTGRVSDSVLGGFRQVIPHLEAFDPALRIGTLTRERLAQYTAQLYERGYKDGTLERHYWFLRECWQLTGRVAPKWLVLPNVRYGKAVGLQRAEVLTLATTPLPPHLDRQRNAFLFQVLLLLRDSDLRALRPHHAQLRELPGGYGPTLCIELYQQKTGEPVLVPLPPLAATIWQHYQGKLPVFSNWHRNKGIRQAAELAGLTREFVQVAFSGKVKHEAVLPVWDALTTHSARHTGATLLTWASDGDQTLKELALGHVSDSVYGSDTLERYGPRLLEAWRKVLTPDRGQVLGNRGQTAEDRGQLCEMPPVLPNIVATTRRFLKYKVEN